MRLRTVIIDYAKMVLLLLFAAPIVGFVGVTVLLYRVWSWFSLHVEFRGDKAAYEKSKAGY